MPQLSESTLAVLEAHVQTGAFCGPALLNELLRGYRAHAEAAHQQDELAEGMKCLLIEWDKFTRYGSPIAKGALAAISRARAILVDREPKP